MRRCRVLPAQELVAVLGDHELDLPLGGVGAVGGSHGPAVGVVHRDLRGACVDHGLDGEAHARDEHGALTGLADEADEGVLVELEADAVAAELADHVEAGGLDAALDGVGHVSEVCPGLDGRETRLDGLAGDLHEAAALVGDLADAEHAAGVREVAVEDGGAVDVDDVAVAQDVVVGGDAVADNVVDARADALGVALVVEVGGDAAVVDGVVVDPLVDLGGGHAGADILGDVVEHADVDGRGALDALDVLGGLEQAAGHDLLAGGGQAVEVLVHAGVALLVLLAGAAPAGVVAAGHVIIVIHG